MSFYLTPMLYLTYVTEKYIITHAGGIGILCRHPHYAGILIQPFLGEKPSVIVDASFTSGQRDLQQGKTTESDRYLLIYKCRTFDCSQ